MRDPAGIEADVTIDARLQSIEGAPFIQGEGAPVHRAEETLSWSEAVRSVVAA
jgi:hypothetical protein